MSKKTIDKTNKHQKQKQKEALIASVREIFDGLKCLVEIPIGDNHFDEIAFYFFQF